MARASKIRDQVAVSLLLLLVPIASVAIAQEGTLPPVPETSPIPSPDLPPPLLPKQQEAVEKLIREEIQNSRTIDDRIQAEVDRTFDRTITLLNLLTTVLIAIPIVVGLAALALRHGAINQLVRDIRQELELEKEHLKQQAAAELKDQLETFKRELESSKADFIHQLQNLFLSAQQEKEQIFQELSKITPSIIQEEMIAPEIQQRIRALTEQLEALKANNSQLFLTAYEYLKQADAFYFEQRYEDALESYQRAIEANPNLVEAWEGKAKTLNRLKRYDDAIAANDRIIQMQPNNPSGWFGKGFVMKDLQKYEEALSLYEQAVQLEPSKHTFWKYKGYTLIKLGQYEEAWACLEKALELKPKSGGAYYWKAYYYASQNQIEPAISNLKTAFNLNSNLREKAKTDPDFDLIRDDDRFQQLIAES